MIIFIFMHIEIFAISRRLIASLKGREKTIFACYDIKILIYHLNYLIFMLSYIEIIQRHCKKYCITDSTWFSCVINQKAYVSYFTSNLERFILVNINAVIDRFKCICVWRIGTSLSLWCEKMQCLTLKCVLKITLSKPLLLSAWN